MAKNKPRLLVSFSGGRTSGYMTKRLLDDYSATHDIRVVFANTGFEHEKTLEFVNNCDLFFGFNTVWVEAIVHHGLRKGNTHRVVTFDTASRNGEPFEEVVKKYGVTNMQFPHCTRDLKLAPIWSYLRSVGWATGSYATAIGIRTDEQRRVRDDKVREIVYPLVDTFPTDKQDVLDWWDDQIFDLELLEHQGNCKTCWKKSFSKLARLHDENPNQFDFFERLEKQYGTCGPEFSKRPGAPARVFFRKRMSIPAFRQLASELSASKLPMPNVYQDAGCSESCELFETEVPTE